MLDKKNGKLNSRKKCSCSCATSIGTPPPPESLTLTLPIQLTIGFSLPSVRFFLFFSPSFYFIILFYVFRQHRPPDTPSYSRNLNYYLQWYFFGCILFLFFAIFFFFFCFLFCSELARRIFIYIYMYTFFIRISRWHKVFYILEGGYPSWCSAPPANFILGEFSSFFYAAAFGGFRLKSNHLQTAIEIYNRHVNQIPIAYFK